MISFPWESIVEGLGENGFPIYDRPYTAEELREVYETFFSNGVFLDTDRAFQVVQADGMTVDVVPGKCHIKGTVGYEKFERRLAFQASSSQDRIDTVVLRWDANIESRSIDLYVKEGIPSPSPVRPELTRDESIYELGLCDVFIPKYTEAIDQERITDTRLETDRCGVVVPFAEIDTTTFYLQLQAAVDRAVQLAQDALDETIAGKLQSQIDALNEQIEEKMAELEGLSGKLDSILLAISEVKTIANNAYTAANNANTNASTASTRANTAITNIATLQSKVQTMNNTNLKAIPSWCLSDRALTNINNYGWKDFVSSNTTYANNAKFTSI